MYQHHLLPMSLVHASDSNRCSFWMFSSDRLLCCTCFSSMQWDAIFTFSWKVIMTFCMAFLIVCHSGTDPLNIDIDIIIHCKSASSSRTLNIIYLFICTFEWACERFTYGDTGSPSLTFPTDVDPMCVPFLSATIVFTVGVMCHRLVLLHMAC